MIDDDSWPPTSLTIDVAVFYMKYPEWSDWHPSSLRWAHILWHAFDRQFHKMDSLSAFFWDFANDRLATSILGFRCLSRNFILLLTGLNLEMPHSKSRPRKMVGMERICQVTGILPHLKYQFCLPHWGFGVMAVGPSGARILWAQPFMKGTQKLLVMQKVGLPAVTG